MYKQMQASADKICIRSIPLTSSPLLSFQCGLFQFDWSGITDDDYIYDEADEKYHCTKCVYGSPRFDKIVEHHKAHIKNKWSCDICGKVFLKVIYLTEIINNWSKTNTKV